MPRKKSPYLVKFQLKAGVDESICRNLKFARKKMEQLGNTYPRKQITVVISGTQLENPQTFTFFGQDWEEKLEMLPSLN